MDRQKPAAPLPVLERRRQPLSAGPEDSGGGLPTGRTDLGYTASDPGAAVEKIDRDLLVGERKQVTCYAPTSRNRSPIRRTAIRTQLLISSEAKSSLRGDASRQP
jgi:hypothetical protein